MGGAPAAANMSRSVWTCGSTAMTPHCMSLFGVVGRVGHGRCHPPVQEAVGALVLGSGREHPDQDLVAVAVLQRVLQSHPQRLAGHRGNLPWTGGLRARVCVALRRPPPTEWQRCLPLM